MNYIGTLHFIARIYTKLGQVQVAEDAIVPLTEE
jgi:hypothetical protein